MQLLPPVVQDLLRMAIEGLLLTPRMAGLGHQARMAAGFPI
jgi:hypothetical protein